MKRPPQNTYEDALAIAWGTLSERDPAQVAAAGLLELDQATGTIKIPFLGDNYFVNIASKHVLFEHGADVYPFLSVLLLHYLTGADETPLAGEWISFREFEGGDAYFGAFTNRSLVPLKETFGDNPDLLPPAAVSISGEPLDYGDVGVRVPVFPKIPLAVVLWRGDSEFPPEGNILFDKTANSTLQTEDLNICSALTVSKLRKNVEKNKKSK